MVTAGESMLGMGREDEEAFTINRFGEQMNLRPLLILILRLHLRHLAYPLPLFGVR